MFDSIFAFASAIKEAGKSLNLNEGKVSCAEDHPLEIGSLLTHYVEKVWIVVDLKSRKTTYFKKKQSKKKVSVQGLTGLISFQNRERRDFSLDILQLKETGLFKVYIFFLH